jgi:hypothetical protein
MFAVAAEQQARNLDGTEPESYREVRVGFCPVTRKHRSQTYCALACVVVLLGTALCLSACGGSSALTSQSSCSEWNHASESKKRVYEEKNPTLLTREQMMYKTPQQEHLFGDKRDQEAVAKGKEIEGACLTQAIEHLSGVSG